MEWPEISAQDDAVAAGKSDPRSRCRVKTKVGCGGGIWPHCQDLANSSITVSLQDDVSSDLQRQVLQRGLEGELPAVYRAGKWQDLALELVADSPKVTGRIDHCFSCRHRVSTVQG